LQYDESFSSDSDSDADSVEESTDPSASNAPRKAADGKHGSDSESVASLHSAPHAAAAVAAGAPAADVDADADEVEPILDKEDSAWGLECASVISALSSAVEEARESYMRLVDVYLRTTFRNSVPFNDRIGMRVDLCKRTFRKTFEPIRTNGLLQIELLRQLESVSIRMYARRGALAAQVKAARGHQLEVESEWAEYRAALNERDIQAGLSWRRGSELNLPPIPEPNFTEADAWRVVEDAIATERAFNERAAEFRRKRSVITGDAQQAMAQCAVETNAAFSAAVAIIQESPITENRQPRSPGSPNTAYMEYLELKDATFGVNLEADSTVEEILQSLRLDDEPRRR
jgi:hypothetical protein